MAVYLFLAVLALSLAAVVWRLVSVGREGDERGRMIVTQAAAWSFVVAAGGLLLDVVEGVVRSAAFSQPIEPVNPLVKLMVLSWVYFISLAVLKRRHGG